MSTSGQRIVHIDIGLASAGTFEIRYDFGEPGSAAEATVGRGVIDDLLELAETDYYLDLSGAQNDEAAILEACGRRLYAALDTPYGYISGFRTRTSGSWTVLVLAITAAAGLANLPWELLHDGTQYLVSARSPVVPVRRVRGAASSGPAEPRPLRMMFMACAPTDDALSTLDYDAEEVAIRAATRRPTIELQFEESGDLDGLSERLNEYDPRYFDVIHLTGHAVRSMAGAVFVTEGSHGNRVDAGADRIGDVIRPHQPRLLFLSGCGTAEPSDVRAAVSLAHDLAEYAAPVVLGWGRSVSDPTATGAAATFYKQIAAGRPMAEALGSTYRGMIDKGDPYWHTLRAYVNGEVPDAFVTPVRARDDRLTPRQLALRDGGQEKPAEFVGRRRLVQEALRVLDRFDDEGPLGLIYSGMAGVGKSTLVSRIATRLSRDYRVVRIKGELTEERLLRALLDYGDRAGIPLEIPTAGTLRQRLLFFVRTYSEQGNPLLLFDLDEFEVNFEGEPGSGKLVLGIEQPRTRPEAAQTFAALVAAVRVYANVPHRIMMSTRYVPDLPEVGDFVVRQVQAMDASERDRLLSATLLARPPSGDPADGRAGPELDQEQLSEITRLAGGNPRLVEWMLKVARNHVDLDIEMLRARLRDEQIEFLEKDVFAPMLIGQLSADERRLIELAEPFDQPVPAVVLARLTSADRRVVDRRAHRLADLSLLERTDGPGGYRFRVPAVLGAQFTVDDPGELRARHAACASALVVELGDFAGEPDPRRLDQPLLREAHRLALAAGDGPLAVDTALALIGIEAFWLRPGGIAKICRVMLQHSHDYRIYAALADAEMELGHPSQGRLMSDLALRRCPPGDTADRAEILASRAFWISYERPGDGLAEADEAVELARGAGDEESLIFPLRTRARIVGERSEPSFYEQAPELLDEAMRLALRQPDSRRFVPGVLLDRAIAVHLADDDVTAAQIDLEEALRIDAELGHSHGQAVTRLTMADAALQRGFVDEAERQVDLALATQVLMRTRLGADLRRGTIAFDRRRFVEAESHYADALQLSLELDNLSQQREALRGLRDVARKIGAVDRVRETVARINEVSRQIDSPEQRYETLVSGAEDGTGDKLDPGDAAAGAREAATVAAAAGWTDREIRAWRLFVDAADRADVPAAELEPALRRLLILLGPGREVEAAEAVDQLGRLLLRAGRFAEAEVHLDRALAFYRARGFRDRSAALHERLAEAARGRGRMAAAADHLRRAAYTRLEVGEGGYLGLAVQTLRELAALQRGESPDDAATTLDMAWTVSRFAPSGRDEQAVLVDAAGLAEERAAGPTGDAVRWRTVAAELRQRARTAGLRDHPLYVGVGADIAAAFDPPGAGGVLAEIERLRATAAGEGWRLPPVQIGEDPALEPRVYVIAVWGVPVASGQTPDTAVGTVLDDLLSTARTNRKRLAVKPRPPGAAGTTLDDIRAALWRPTADRQE